jgi:hypothetical protein
MEMHPSCQRISLVSILFVLLSSSKTAPREPFWTTVIAKTLQQKDVGDRLAQQRSFGGQKGVGRRGFPSTLGLSKGIVPFRPVPEFHLKIPKASY